MTPFFETVTKITAIQSATDGNAERSRSLIVGITCTLAMSLLTAIATVGQAGSSPVDVSLNQLINHPDRYNGKRVSVRAYLVTSCTHCRELWASVQAARESRVRDSSVQNWISFGDLARSIMLSKVLSDGLKRQDYDGYVRVTGKFRYKRLTAQTLLTGFGWGHLNDKQITEVTQLQPLGPPIPARVN
jgi:hypothetical protein